MTGDAVWLERGGTIACTELWAAREVGLHVTIRTKPLLADATTEFSFHKPDPVLDLQILQQLAQVCGPFIFVDHADLSTVVVIGDSSVTELERQLFGS